MKIRLKFITKIMIMNDFLKSGDHFMSIQNGHDQWSFRDPNDCDQRPAQQLDRWANSPDDNEVML